MILSVPFCPCHFVRAILSVPFCPLPFCPGTYNTDQIYNAHKVTPKYESEAWWILLTNHMFLALPIEKALTKTHAHKWYTNAFIYLPNNAVRILHAKPWRQHSPVGASECNDRAVPGPRNVALYLVYQNCKVSQSLLSWQIANVLQILQTTIVRSNFCSASVQGVTRKTFWGG